MNVTKVDKPEMMTPIFNMDSPKTRTFLRLMHGAKNTPFHISDFLDDRIPAMKTQDVDQSLLSEKPKGIHTDKEMMGAWRFMQMMLQKAELGALQPLEIVEMYRSMNDCGNFLKELSSIKREIKDIKHQIKVSKEVESSLLEQLNAAEQKKETIEAEIAHCANLPRSQRVAQTQGVLIIGFLKEYISLRAVRVENAEEYAVWVPIPKEEDIAKYLNEDSTYVIVPAGDYQFFASPIEAYQNNASAVRFVPVLKKAFAKEFRIGDDMIDYIKISLHDSISLPISGNILTSDEVQAMIPQPKPMDMAPNDSTVTTQEPAVDIQPEQAVEP